jgi:SecD/SecF fusion protein
MQNKGVITLFAIVFALACLYELSYTFVARSVQNDAREFANGDVAKENNYLDSMLSEEVYPVLGYTYSEVKNKEINLGLDLKGGMNVILEVSVKDVLRGIANNSPDIMLAEALANADKAQANSQSAYVESFFNEFDKLNQASGAPRPYADPTLFGTPEMTDRVGFNASDDVVKDEIRKDIDAAVSNVFTVLRARIDQFGVVQPNIQRLENSGRILIELPGVKDPSRVQKLLQSTAELQFWRLYEASEVLPFFAQANEKLRSIVERPDVKNEIDETGAVETEDIFDINDITNVEEDTLIDADAIETVDDSTTEATDAASDSLVQEQQFNPLFEVFGPSVDQRGIPMEGARIGYAAIKDTQKVNAYLRMPQIRALLPPSLRYAKFLWTNKPEKNTDVLILLAIQGNREDKPDLDGGVVVNARSDFDEFGRPVVNMTMNGVGAQKWQKITAEAAQQDPKRSVAVVLDNYVYSYPQVQGEISGGSTRISGNFTVQEADDLANILKAGKLDAPARIIQADVVGPSLGKEAIQASVRSFLVALLIVLIYMIFYYSQAGLVADFALVINMFFIFGILDALGAVLTLPGMAGIVLTIGMAVDANVLIFERIREELLQGKGLRAAIKDGYNHSYSAIIDANFTTLLTGIILYAFGTGPIRGFATTLIIGILTSLFCAIFVSRLVFEWRLSKKSDVSFYTKFTKDWWTNVNINFLSKRKVAYIISGALLLVALGSLGTRGLNLGVDFQGGRSFQVRFDQAVNVADIANSLGDRFVDAEGNKFIPIVKTLGEPNQVIITTNYRINETGADIEDQIKAQLYDGVNGFYAESISSQNFLTDTEDGLGVIATRVVGPTIADDIKSAAVWAIVLALIVIFIYIMIRFRKWQFSLGAVAAIAHDVILVLGAFSLLNGILPFQLEIDQAFIAAILTVIGYSLNDTVVVFDRIREYDSHYHAKRPLIDIFNGAINQTLSRTFNTSVTTFFVMLIIFSFGGESIRGFMFALLLGIIVGTYSSIFIASPVTYDSRKDKGLDK